MKATIVDLRYRMKDVLRALDRNEEVKVMYRGKLKGILRPPQQDTGIKVRDHPFFNMRPDDMPVEQKMEELRGGRYRAI